MRNLIAGMALLMSVCAALADIKVIHVNPGSGDDGNPGSQQAPVRTQERAEELLRGQIGQIILPTGVITFTGTKHFKPPQPAQPAK